MLIGTPECYSSFCTDAGASANIGQATSCGKVEQFMATQDEKIKWVEGSPFMVDGFRFANPRCKHYLLTHFHSDHTTGLYKSFSAGTIYASQGTAQLVIELIGVNAERVVALPMNRPVTVAGFELTLIDANHCPAAVMFLIRDPRPGGRLSLHTGDFRAEESVCRDPAVISLRGRLDALYLDTTYCAPRHTFPTQGLVLAEVARIVEMELERDPNTLFLVGTYSIGKERVLEAVARAAHSRCLVNSRKARIMRLSGAWKDSAYTTHDASTGGGIGDAVYARVRAVALQVTNSPSALRDVLAEARASGAPFTSVVGVRPTGWAHTNGGKGGGKNRTGAEKGNDGGGKIRVVCSETGATEGQKRGPASRGNGDIGDEDDEAAAWGGDGEEEAMDNQEGDAGERWPREMGAPPLLEAGGDSFSAKKPWVEGNARVYSVPYSEHSSFSQLKNFVRVVRPKAIVPTVNGASAASVERMLQYFFEYMDLSRDRKRLDSYFCKRPAPLGSNGNCKVTCKSTAGHFPTSASCGTSVSGNPTPAKEAPYHRLVDRPVKVQRVRSSSPAPSPLSARENDQIGVEMHHVELAADPCAQGTSAVASTPAPSITRVGGVPRVAPAVDAGGAGGTPEAVVELDLVDVEAQKAIMADIERRKREQQEAQHGSAECKWSSRRDKLKASSLGNQAEADNAKGAKESTSRRKRSPAGIFTASTSKTPTGAKRGHKLETGEAKNAVREPEGTTVGSSGRGQRTLMIGKNDDTPSEKMNIRDFFSRRR